MDDDELLLRVTSRALSNAGHTVYRATNARDAMTLARHHRLDCAIVDYDLGRESGLDLLQMCRERYPRCIRILMTSVRDENVFADAINMAVHRLLRKPFATDGLFETVDGAIAEAAIPDARDRHRAQTELASLDAAMQQLRMALQPIVCLTQDGPIIVAREALLRPNHPDLSTPTQLLRMAERHGRIPEVGSRVFHLAVDAIEQISSDELLFVNLHPTQLGNPDELEEHLEPLVPFADRIVLEITEREDLTGIQHWQRSIHLIDALGFSVAIDDLGAGYSSLAMLADLAPRFMKLDMGLVQGIDRDPRRRRLVTLLQRFGDATDTRVIAEGVESKAESITLWECGVTVMQGYYFGHPTLIEPPTLADTVP